ncbi:DUF2793 domain-containing protein [Ponticoccus alexandrii]|uniref:DUF2793 domain-containing protein n=1 Tax=Ponticoccus alexandrii TaxID=1943633 RepID=A0ABX7FEC0_9RHOB|nr:DUF2793 domain-containing protein [Ponticoccus alexandrii]QRF68901.1 DUF2793 domain-containing protein [Ponticoccus alexandrii]
MTSSHRLSLPFIAPAQAQKHVTHNEALRRIDLVVQLCVETVDALEPPALPEDGLVYALGQAPTGAWAGHPEQLAMWDDNAWGFIAPQIGWQAWDRNTEALRIWDGAAWIAVASASDTFETVGINTEADAVNRLTLASDASLFTHDGTGHQIKVNKASANDTASLLYQTEHSGRAEMGLAGNDNFSIKVSADGSAWNEAMVVDAASGRIGVGTDTPSYKLHVTGPTSYVALEDDNGVLGGSMSAAVRLFAGSQEHGQLGFPGTGSGTMFLRNLQGDMYIEADSRNLAANSFIRFAVDGYETMRARPTGVGFGTISPARPLHVNHVMRLEPGNAPAAPAAGDLYFDASTSKLRCHDGSQWHDLF